MHFQDELNFIQTPGIKKLAELGVELIPEYFYKIPASSTGKYHPSYTIGEEGLYRHVKAAVAIAKMLFRIYEFNQEQQDLILASLILHDGWKSGVTDSGHTQHAHPLIAADVLQECLIVTEQTDKDWLQTICDNISAHMGQWTTDRFSKTVLPKPETEMQKFVHLCDYIASRKPLEFNFAVPVV